MKHLKIKIKHKEFKKTKGKTMIIKKIKQGTKILSASDQYMWNQNLVMGFLIK